MNTDTPETDTFAIKFKTPCGEKYWVPMDIARKIERERDEARADLEFGRFLYVLQTARLERIERERDDARAQIDLFETNLKIQTKHTENAVQDRADEHVELHNQIHEITEQRDRLAEALKQCREDSVELLGERDWWLNETRLNYHKRYEVTRDNIDRADEALQSLTPNEP